jgi:hypothetical protein
MVQVLAAVVEAELALFEVQVEPALVHAAEAGEPGLGVAPEAPSPMWRYLDMRSRRQFSNRFTVLRLTPVSCAIWTAVGLAATCRANRRKTCSKTRVRTT